MSLVQAVYVSAPESVNMQQSIPPHIWDEINSIYCFIVNV